MPLSRIARSSAIKLRKMTLLPNELWFNITARVLGEYLRDVLTNATDPYDAITVLLHVNVMLRACTMNPLYSLWGDTFINPRDMSLSNYQTFVALLRECSADAQADVLDSQAGFAAHKEPTRAFHRSLCAIVAMSERYFACVKRESMFLSIGFWLYFESDLDGVTKWTKELIATTQDCANAPLWEGVIEALLEQQFRVLKVNLVGAILWDLRSAIQASDSSEWAQTTTIEDILESAKQSRAKAVTEFECNARAMLLDKADVDLARAPLTAKHVYALVMYGQTNMLQSYVKRGGKWRTLCQIWYMILPMKTNRQADSQRFSGSKVT
ncbi:hypothetical protein BV25DRAFT_1164056 [Artomyces pyxidatus]|uniref:Uncharacterized protein n=1 Tax=Artomyces pyxidatus TaxID=48021 RepID=A0ACB8SS42_9AGAM|nr:hypothetical protein BV25DRAFT_1164056 [Artomyces pyxidatus]